MDITVEKLDDINFILRGTVANSIIQDEVAKLKAQDADASEQSTPAQTIEQQAASQVFKMFIDMGIKEAGIDVESLLGQPGLKKYEQQDEKVYVEVELATDPKIDVNIDLSDIIPEYTKPIADPKEVEAKMEEFVKKQADFKKIDQPRPAILGDVAVIDFKGFIDGEPFEGGSATEFKLHLGSKSFIPGFEEQLVGMEYGEERTISVTFPQDYQAADLAGKETTFDIKLHEIHQQIAVTVDDAFAQKVLNDSNATVALLKEKLADQVISQELSELYAYTLKPKIVQGLLTKFTFTLPNNIVEQEIDAKVREKIQHLTEEEQKAELEDKQKFIALRDSVREAAKAAIKISLIVEALAKHAGIDVDEQEIVSALTYQAMTSGQDAQQVVQYYRENNLMTSVKIALTEDKLFGQMLGFHR